MPTADLSSSLLLLNPAAAPADRLAGASSIDGRLSNTLLLSFFRPRRMISVEGAHAAAAVAQSVLGELGRPPPPVGAIGRARPVWGKGAVR